MCVVIFSLTVQGPIFDSLGIKSSNFVESQGVTFQQIARTVLEEGDIDAEEYGFIENIIPIDDIKILYNKNSLDDIKFSENFNDNYLKPTFKNTIRFGFRY